jgi:hypothetical protein
VVTLEDKDNRRNRVKLVRDPRGDIWIEVTAIHGTTEVYSALRVGALWEILPRLAQLT